MPFINTGMRRASASASRAFSAWPHHTLVPAMITGSLSAGEQIHRNAERVAVGLNRRGRDGQRTRAPAVVSLTEHVIHREVDERDAGASGTAGAHGSPQRIVDQPADGVGRLCGGGEPRQRCHEGHMVDLLQ